MERSSLEQTDHCKDSTIYCTYFELRTEQLKIRVRKRLQTDRKITLEEGSRAERKVRKENKLGVMHKKKGRKGT